MLLFAPACPPTLWPTPASVPAPLLFGDTWDVVTGFFSSQEMIATQQEMNDAKLDLAFRDYCAHMLIPLNKCRRSTFYLPWQCEQERHSYEKCQHDE